MVMPDFSMDKNFALDHGRAWFLTMDRTCLEKNKQGTSLFKKKKK